MSELRIVKGNDFRTRTEVKPIDLEGNPIQDFDLLMAEDVTCIALSSYCKDTLPISIGDGNMLYAEWPASMQHLGTYDMVIKGKYFGKAWQICNSGVLRIVRTNAEANIPAESYIDTDFYQLTATFHLIPAYFSVQSDWEEEDDTQAGYIKNKPTDVSAFTNDAGYLTEHQDISGLATKKELRGKADLLHTHTAKDITDWNEATSGFLTEHQDISGLAPYSYFWTGTQEEFDSLTEDFVSTHICFITEE